MAEEDTKDRTPGTTDDESVEPSGTDELSTSEGTLTSSEGASESLNDEDIVDGEIVEGDVIEGEVVVPDGWAEAFAMPGSEPIPEDGASPAAEPDAEAGLGALPQDLDLEGLEGKTLSCSSRPPKTMPQKVLLNSVKLCLAMMGASSTMFSLVLMTVV